MDDALATVASAAAAEVGGIDPALLGGYIDELVRASSTRTRMDDAALASCQALGSRAAEQAVPLRALIDLYLTATWRAWHSLPGVRDAADVATAVDAGEAVLRVADDAVAAAAEGYQGARRWVIRREEAARREFVDDVLSGAADPSRLLTRAEQFGIDVVGTHAVVVTAARKPFRDATPVVARAETAVDAAAGEGSLVATKEGRLVCVLPVRSPEAIDGVVRALTTVLDHAFTPPNPPPVRRPASSSALAPASAHTRESDSARKGQVAQKRAGAAQPQPLWRCGVGRAHAGPAGVVRSYEEARDALKLADLLELAVSTVSIGDLLVYRVLLRDHEAIADLIDSVLTPLRQARGGAGPLIDTISMYARTGANAAETARRLHLSVRAITYRLGRVKELTGHDPSVPSELYVLHTAALGAKLIGRQI